MLWLRSKPAFLDSDHAVESEEDKVPETLEETLEAGSDIVTSWFGKTVTKARQ